MVSLDTWVPQRLRCQPHILEGASSSLAGGASFLPRCAAACTSWPCPAGDAASSGYIHGIAYSQSSCGLVAMTSASHAEGRQFDPGQVYFSTMVACNIVVESDVTHVN